MTKRVDSPDIERWSDRFKPKTASAAQAAIRLQQVHQARQYDRDLHPPAVFDAVMEKKRKNKASEGEQSRASDFLTYCFIDSLMNIPQVKGNVKSRLVYSKETT